MAFDSDPEKRRAGLEKMAEVYGWEVSDGDGDFFGYTVEHLFGEIWQRERPCRCGTGACC